MANCRTIYVGAGMEDGVPQQCVSVLLVFLPSHVFSRGRGTLPSDF